MNVVISQPMFFPWVGFLEQMRLADQYVHYDDVQFSKGSFTNRVQIKTPGGPTWLTVPLRNLRLGQSIREVRIAGDKNWRAGHVELLSRNYGKAPFVNDMLDIVQRVYANQTDLLVDIAIASMQALLDYFGIASATRFHYSSKMGIPGRGSDRVLDIVKTLGGTSYITGHGARNYLRHEEFEAQGVRVEYLDYRKKEYPQLHGPFNPYVSALDLIAGLGKAGAEKICSPARYWRDFLDDVNGGDHR